MNFVGKILHLVYLELNYVCKLKIEAFGEQNIKFVEMESKVFEQYNLSYFQKLITVFALEH